MGSGSPRAGAGAGGLLVLLGLLLRPAPGARVPAGNSPGEPVTPRWVLDGQPWRPVTLGDPTLKPDTALVVVEVDGQELLLELERKRRLLAPGYTETHYSPEGQPLVLAPSHADLCHYQGRVRGFPHSWVVLSTCSGMSGLIRLSGNTSYYLRPPPPGRSQDFSTHRIFRTEQLLSQQGACGYPDPEDRGRTANLRPARQRREPEAHRSWRYLELYLVADHALFLIQHRNLNRTKQRLLEVASYVDQILRTLDIQVVLTGLEVWTEQDRSLVSPDANATLWAFLRWRRGLWARRPHDSAQLLTGRAFQGTTVGLAPVKGMCGAESSGGVSMDHAELPLGAAATMAHEIGHSLGLGHDPDGCCREAEPGGCVMEAATGRPFPRVFSACSRRQLRAFFRKGGGACLSDAPEPGLPLPAARCGNGFVEPGEACDCGPSQKCQDPCCLAHNCSLRAGARCAHGDCCARCQLKPAGTPCRRATGDCDLPEFCTGASPHCPADVFLLDGWPCAGGRGYCRDGACPTLQEQCGRLRGPGSRPAPEACFRALNSAGDAGGNCGQDHRGRFLPCAPRDALCGTLQCVGGHPSPLVPTTVAVDFEVPLEGSEVACPGAFVLPEAQHELPDLLLVEPGTQCAPRMVCQDRRCQNATFQQLDGCLAACHSRGVCNSNQNCHCNPGWAPPFCDRPGSGGSVDSGPVQPESGDAFALAVLLSFLLPLLPGAGMAWCCFRGLHLQRCPRGCRRGPTCNRPKDATCRDHPVGGLHSMELGPTATGELQALDAGNSAGAQQPP